jgi:phytoene/squalene synthetase
MSLAAISLAAISLAEVADAVRRADPDRFAAAMAAPPERRAGLLALYAVNLEIARAPWASAEPLVAEMRLQWWRDAAGAIGQGRPPAGHAALAALAQAVAAAGLDPADAAGLLDAMAAARRSDIWAEPWPDEAALWAHLDATAGGVMVLAARLLGAPPAADPVVRRFAQGAGMAAWLRAVPAYAARGRTPLPDPGPAAVAGLARAGLAALAEARAHRAAVPAAAAPARLAGAPAGLVLRRAARQPGRVAAGTLAPSEARRRLVLLLRATSGRW